MSQIRFPAHLGLAVLISLWVPMAQVGATAPERRGDASAGGLDNPIEIILPFEMQASLFHSLPIAGHIMTPDQIAQLVMTNPRLRATTSLPYSGKGTAIPIQQSEVAGTRADLFAVNDKPFRGADRAPKP